MTVKMPFIEGATFSAKQAVVVTHFSSPNSLTCSF